MRCAEGALGDEERFLDWADRRVRGTNAEEKSRSAPLGMTGFGVMCEWRAGQAPPLRRESAAGATFAADEMSGAR